MKIRKDIEEQLEKTKTILMSNEEYNFFTGWRGEYNARLDMEWDRIMANMVNTININNLQQNSSYERNV